MTVTEPVTDIESAHDVLERVRTLVPFLRENAAETEALRQVPEKNIDALAAAGLFRLTLPRTRGGFEAPVALQNDILAEVARGCPSTGWVCTLITAMNWMINLFPDQAQEDIYATPGVRAAGVFAPTGKGKRQDGGIVVSGRWAFNTGAANAHWAGLTAMVEDEDGGVAPQFLMIPYSELDFEDDWYACGLSGTGSRTTVAREVFVPGHRALPVQNLATGNYPGSTASAENPYFRTPGIALFLAASAGPPIGIARGALDVFLERLPGRTITYTDYASQSEAPITHHQVAEATLKLFSAEAHSTRAAALIDGNLGKPLSLPDRAEIRGHLGHATKLCREVVDVLFQASGASAIQNSVPIQRYHRDMQSLSLHALMQPNTNTELYGRVLLGLDPNTNTI
ncbi:MULTISPECIES: acyl-CoA dehydrogenase family protein [Rhodococcus]|uniref:acyl-CoA dehydrogenase family protein n=1 Tax=Rhodococcus TaxID=1827 RepID=UPI0015E0EF5F|nr:MULTISPECIES: acyl-CoA dehydrogenase family protein [Rhodococcus]WKX00294.1 acyl-CoA dehydrogenase family protein [Rhodococcus aetherivorans]